MKPMDIDSDTLGMLETEYEVGVTTASNEFYSHRTSRFLTSKRQCQYRGQLGRHSIHQ